MEEKSFAQFKNAANVATVLNQHREEIAEDWVLLMPPLLYPVEPEGFARMKIQVLGFLDTLSEALRAGSYEAVDLPVYQTATKLYARSVDIGVAMTGLGQGREAVLDVLRRVYPNDADLVLDSINQFDQGLNYCAVLFSRRYTAEIEGQLLELQARTNPSHCSAAYSKRYTAEIEQLLRQRQAQTQSVLDTARAASSTLGLDEILAHAARMIGKALGVRNCIVNAIDDHQKLLLFRRAGVIGIVNDEINAGLSASDLDLPLEEMPAFNLLVLKHKKPIIVEHAESDLRLHTLKGFLPGAKSVLGLPFVVKDRAVGLALVWTENDDHPFNPEELDLAQGIANVAALAIDNARLYGEADRLARIEERQRISLELHDNVAQLAFSIGLHAHQALEDATLSESSRSHLSTIEHMAARSSFELRSAIFALERSEMEGESELVSLLRELVNNFHSTTGIRATLILPDELPVMPAMVCACIFRVVRESLYNVQKHSRASAALVSLRSGDHSIIVSIQDDGVGIPDQLTHEQNEDGLHFGLAAMRHMVQENEGEFTITNNDDGGALVKVRLPLKQR